MSDQNYILYGMQASLYTGKVRAYLRRNRIPVIERGAGHPEFTGKILPHMNRFIMPVVVTPDGDVLQDGTDIIDFFQNEGLGKEILIPESPAVRAIAHFFELFGNEGLLRPAMHYRWNFDADNLSFLKSSFADAFPAHLDSDGRAAAFDHASGRMRKAATAFGVVPETFEEIENSYLEFLLLLNAHLEKTYFLLGACPTVADYALFNPLYAHLGRDPKPANLMKTQAPFVWNWVERMNRPEILQEHTVDNPPTDQFTLENIPDSLKRLLAYVSEEYSMEFSAHVDFANMWLNEKADGSEVKKGSLNRGMGFAEFNWRGHDIKTVVMAYRFYLAQRLWDHYDGCEEVDRLAIRNLFSDFGLEIFLEKRPNRRVLRTNYHEVWDI